MSGAALDLQDIWSLMTAQFLTSWVTLSDHWDVSLWDAENLVNSQEQRASVRVVIIPYPMPHPSKVLDLHHAILQAILLVSLASWIKGGIFLHSQCACHSFRSW